MKISEQEKSLRKRKILEAAFDLFCLKGIEQVSVAEIAAQATVSDMTVYRYFTNKKELVVQTIALLWQRVSEDLCGKVLRTAGYQEMSGYEQIAVQLQCYSQLYLKHSDYVLFSYDYKLFILRNAVKISSKQCDYVTECIHEMCVGAIEKGKADGSIPVTESSEDLFYAIWGTVRGYIVKIVIYTLLCEDKNQWIERYRLVEQGILTALKHGWVG